MTASFVNNGLQTWQNLDALAENDAVITPHFGAVPSFGVYRSGTQSIPASTETKIQFNAEEWDSDGLFDSATNYRFTPNKAGKYLFVARLAFASTQDAKLFLLRLFKNGAVVRNGALIHTHATTGIDIGVQLCAMETANGTTDYFEIHGTHTQTGAINVQSGTQKSYFAGGWVRT